MAKNFDPMTGEPLRNFDPMTGEPLNRQEERKFDPMTGEPIGNQGEKNFDPMTGEPINNTRQGARNFDPKTGKPVRRKMKFAAWMIAIPVLVIVIAVGAFAGVKSGVFMSKSQKTLVAVYNTLNDSNTFVEVLKPLSVLSGDQYTVSMDIDMEDMLSVSAELASKTKQKQLSGSVSVMGYTSIEFNAGLTSEEVQLQVPAIDSRLFVYNYTDTKTGYIAEVLTDEEIEEIDRLCEMVASSNTQQEQMEELADIFYDAYKELEFESVSSAEYEIDGKDRNCKGYSTTIDSRDVRNLMGDLEDFVDEYYGELIETYSDYTVREIFNEMSDELAYMPDIDVTFYVYKNKLACIMIESEGESAEIIFHGGDSRMQNIEIVDSYGDTLLAITGEIEDSVETLSLEVDESSIGYLTYSTKTGEFSLVAVAGGSYMALNGYLESDKKSLDFSTSSIVVDGEGVELDLSLSVSEGASIESLSGEKFDVGDASEEELEALVEELEASLMTLFY